MKILVLYTRLTGYWMACMRNDHKRTGNGYLVIRKSPSPMAPFKINSEKGIEIVDGDQMSASDIREVSEEFSPDLLYVSGWGDKRFRKIARLFRKRDIPVIMGMDNHWKGSIWQVIAGSVGPLFLKRLFSHIWIPGDPQYYYARKLGFEEREIHTGLYCADEHKFKEINQDKSDKQITFVGRLVEHKGLKILFEVLEELIAENNLNFKVHLIGSGPFESKIPKHPLVSHSPFVDPEELPMKLSNAGFFILPSLYEAWGVVIHEAALAGLPIISTHETGATSEFLIDGFNGFRYKADNASALKDILLGINEIGEDEYFRMSQNSKMLASRISLNTWAGTLNSVN